ncbi:hypothetical protein NS220_09225 [Microbacterium testaceum]|uniref:Protein-glutamine gamma-glutamyltransferase-like C-terminal domain-containing protein n=1 Tax=Microbacterium testaceum TaxID=2033 RepID=A0A147EX81_MICTE|nr:DUF4129 domain-containing protein [Microbacterium testaceum]KTR94373.1 hypothetical protein NS220_09225 [Microbacterium testaceum]
MIPPLARVAAALTALSPDADEAREWAERELSDPAYRAAEPTPIDRLARAVVDFFGELLKNSANGDWGPPALIVLAIIVVVAIVIGILIWGRPRAVARAQPPARALFDDDDGRSADELRRDAAAAATRGDWDAAIVLRFRAFARGLTERGLVDPPPGATVRTFARAAATALPPLSAGLEEAASIFDDVRYLRRPGTEQRYGVVADLDADAVRTRPTPAALAGTS